MNANVHLDETDIKILTILLRDARAKQVGIAKECGMSQVNILKRINRLKKWGVITGSTIFLNTSAIGLPIVATIGINVRGCDENEVLKALEEHAYIVEASKSVGEYDICALLFAENVNSLDKIACSIKEQCETGKVTINLWLGPPKLTYDNFDLQPLRRQE
jgi:Lrp/AsnC family transcriptional regulator, regulator for asnA, asnC and gidA